MGLFLELNSRALSRRRVVLWWEFGKVWSGNEWTRRGQKERLIGYAVEALFGVANHHMSG